DRLLTTQRDHWINFRRPSGRNEAGEQRCAREQRRDNGESQRVKGQPTKPGALEATHTHAPIFIFSGRRRERHVRLLRTLSTGDVTPPSDPLVRPAGPAHIRRTTPRSA